MPKEFDTTFYLTIFSLSDSEKEKLTRKEKLKKKILEIRPNLAINIEIFQNSTADFHDRAIITNYIWIEIGAGFDIIKDDGKASKETNIHITYPMIIPEKRIRSGNNGYWNIIDSAKKCLKNRNKVSNNRLLR